MLDRSSSRRGEGSSRWWLVVCGLLVVLLGRTAFAVLIASGDGTGNTSAPRDDPGWNRMGARADCPPECRSSYVYLGQSWFISTYGAGPHDIRIESTQQIYKKIPKNAFRIGRKKDPTNLMIFRVQGGPDLPLIEISKKPPIAGTEVIMMGRGLSRGVKVTYREVQGWEATEPSVLRWGTNKVTQNRVEKLMRMFTMRFDDPSSHAGTRHEAHAVLGDLGGGVFVKKEGVWELAGILVGSTDAYIRAGKTLAIDLAKYRDEILDIIHSRE